MTLHEIERRDIRSEDGQLLATKVLWNEVDPLSQGWMTLMIGLGIVAVVAGFALVGKMGFPNGPLVLGAVFTPLMALSLFFDAGKPRAVTFFHFGRIWTAYGIPWRPGLRALDGYHADIVSIESKARTALGPQPGVTYDVILVSSGGDIVTVSHNLPEWVAFKVAVQLTTALSDLRRELTEASVELED